MEIINDLLPFLVPLIIVQLILLVVAFKDLSQRPVTRGPKWMWILIILFVNFIGPIAYFAIGREDE